MVTRRAVATGASVWLLGVLLVYGALILPTVDRQGVNWDEQTDLTIASVYTSSLGGPVFGTRDDAINTRLPMYTAGLLFRLIGDVDLRAARLLSCIVGALTIVAVYLFGRLEFDWKVGLLAAALVGTSPYFLYFSKQALTEGDVFVTAAFAWLLVAVAWYGQRPVLGRAALAGIALGATLSAKISGVALVPAVALAILVLPNKTAHPPMDRPSSESRRSLLPLVASLIGFVVWLAVTAAVIRTIYFDWGHSLRSLESHPLPRLGFGVLLAGFLSAWIIRRRNDRLPGVWTLAASMLVAAWTFLLVPPVHTSNPWILRSLWAEFFQAGTGLDFRKIAEAAVFHLEVILVKGGLIPGLLLLSGLALAILRWRRLPRLWFALAGFGLYFVFLTLLPWAQTRYMMPLVPVLAVLAAMTMVDICRRRPVPGLVVALLVAASVVWNLWIYYPDLNLTGYRLLGERFLLGRCTVGYRSLVHTPSDGIEQALRWLEDRPSPGQVVTTFYGENHISRAILEDTAFRIVSGINEGGSLSEADWVVTSINYDIRPHPSENSPEDGIYGYPYYDRDELERDFVKVFSVVRTFDLEVAAVWRRRAPPSSRPPIVHLGG